MCEGEGERKQWTGELMKETATAGGLDSLIRLTCSLPIVPRSGGGGRARRTVPVLGDLSADRGDVLDPHGGRDHH